MPGQEASGPDRPSWYMPYGASGGGADGQYVFTDLDELDGIITELEEIRDELDEDDRYYGQAIDLATSPADDVMSRGQVGAYITSLRVGQNHNAAMAQYAVNARVVVAGLVAFGLMGVTGCDQHDGDRHPTTRGIR